MGYIFGYKILYDVSPFTILDYNIPEMTQTQVNAFAINRYNISGTKIIKTQRSKLETDNYDLRLSASIKDEYSLFVIGCRFPSKFL